MLRIQFYEVTDVSKKRTNCPIFDISEGWKPNSNTTGIYLV